MRLNPEPFENIKNGSKTIEMRLFDEKRQQIKQGDSIEFTNNKTDEKLVVRVINLHQFASFDELYRNFDKTKLGYKPNETAHPNDMSQYYSKDDILKFGVIGIEIKKIH